MTSDKGAVALVSMAYLWWGSSAIFWNELSSVSPIDQLGFRVVTACLYLVFGVGVMRSRLAERGIDATLFAAGALRSHLTRRHLSFGVGGAVMISANWALFLWAVSNGQAVEAALGYFLMPLFSVALGVGLLGERLGRLQVVALLLSVVGITWTVLVVGSLPLVAIFVGLTFAIYGFLRKRGPWDAVSGLVFETTVLAPLLAVVLVVRGSTGASLLGDGAPSTIALLALTGFITIVPLLAFGSASRRVPLSVIGLLQYINPTLQFLVGWQVLGEGVSNSRLVGFCWIWVALAMVVYDEIRSQRPIDGSSVASNKSLVRGAEGPASEEAPVSGERGGVR